MSSIKETQEVLEFLRILGEKAVEMKADGAISLVEVLEAAYSLARPGMDAINGFEKVSAELKDLEADEVASLAAEMFVVVKAFLPLLK